jgi:hypothetical protein
MIAVIILPLVDLILTIVEGLISLRVILKLFGAFSGAPFVSWVYETTNPLLQPFTGMFPSPRVDGRFVIEFSALFALVIYATAGYLISALVEQLTSLKKVVRKIKSE